MKFNKLQKSDYPSKHYYEKFNILAIHTGYDSPEEMLYDLYIIQKIGTVKLAKKLKVSRRAVLALLNCMNIETRKGGHKARKDIDNQEVLQFIKNHTYKETAKKFKCSFSTIQHIVANQRNNPTNNKSPKNKTKICECCGKYPVKKGNRFLCKYCYRGETHKYKKTDISNEEIYSVSGFSPIELDNLV